MAKKSPLPNTNASMSPLIEFGITGITRYGAVSRVYEEFLKELQGPDGMKLYREQIDNCPVTGAFLFAAQHLARQVSWRVEPANSSNEAAKVAERIRGALFDDMELTWPDQLSETLTMLGYGWANFEMVFKRCRGRSSSDLTLPAILAGPRGQGPQTGPEPKFGPDGVADPGRVPFVPSQYNDGFLGFKKLSIRAQETLFMWEWDDESGVRVMQQMAPPDFKVRRVPMAKCLLFRTENRKNNPEGRSLLRNSTISYLYRKGIQQVEAIGIERDLAGYPTFQMKSPKEAEGHGMPDPWNKNDPNAAILLQKLQATVRQIRRDEQEGLVLPWWLDFKLVSAGGSRRQFDTNTIITRYDQRIAMAVLADFVLIGHQAQGSKALASTKSALFTTALSSFLTNIAAVYNRFAIPLLLELNGIPADLAPTLEHGDVETIDIADLGTFISNLAKAGMPLFPDPDLESALRQAAKLPDSAVENEDQEQYGDPSDLVTDLPEPGAPDPASQTQPAPNVVTSLPPPAPPSGGTRRLARPQSQPAPPQDVTKRAYEDGLREGGVDLVKFSEATARLVSTMDAQHAAVRKEIAGLAAVVKQIQEAPAPAPQPAPTINIAPPEIVIHNSPPAVHIAAPEITLRPDVTVAVEAPEQPKPTRKKLRVTKRDRQGRMLESEVIG